MRKENLIYSVLRVEGKAFARHPRIAEEVEITALYGNNNCDYKYSNGNGVCPIDDLTEIRFEMINAVLNKMEREDNKNFDAFVDLCEKNNIKLEGEKYHLVSIWFELFKSVDNEQEGWENLKDKIRGLDL